MLTCRDVTIGYDGKTAVSGVSFDLERGDYLCIVGENGSGKSTLMKGILGLLKPACGHISYAGIKQTALGYLPQQTPAQKDFPASVSEVVLSGCANRHGLLPFYTKHDKELAKRNMERLGITDLKHHSYRDLSGGQQQRVLLARALCAAEDLLLLDEPVTGLDPVMSAQMYALLEKLNCDDNVTIIMISHDINSAVKYGNKILHLKTSPLYFGPTGDYVKTPVYARMIGSEANG